MSSDGSILLALLKYGTMTFRNLQKTTKISPRILRRHLDGLSEKDLVFEDKPDSWKRGQKKHYTITKEGEENVVGDAFSNISSALERIRDLTTTLANDPKRLSELRELFHLPPKPSEFENFNFEDYIERFNKESKRIHGPLRESLKAIFDIFLATELSPHEQPKQGFVMGFTKEGWVYLIPIASLKKHGLGVGL